MCTLLRKTMLDLFSKDSIHEYIRDTSSIYIHLILTEIIDLKIMYGMNK